MPVYALRLQKREATTDFTPPPPPQGLKSGDHEIQAQEWEESKEIKTAAVQSQRTSIVHLSVPGTRQIHGRHTGTENLPSSAQLKLYLAWMSPSFIHETDSFSEARAAKFTDGLEASFIFALRVSCREGRFSQPGQERP